MQYNSPSHLIKMIPEQPDAADLEDLEQNPLAIPLDDPDNAFYWILVQDHLSEPGELDPAGALQIFLNCMMDNIYPPQTVLRWIEKGLRSYCRHYQGRANNIIESSLGLIGREGHKNSNRLDQRKKSYKEITMSRDVHWLTVVLEFTKLDAYILCAAKYGYKHHESVGRIFRNNKGFIDRMIKMRSMDDQEFQEYMVAQCFEACQGWIAQFCEDDRFEEGLTERLNNALKHVKRNIKRKNDQQ